jgi:hypothetical protein
VEWGCDQLGSGTVYRIGVKLYYVWRKSCVYIPSVVQYLKNARCVSIKNSAGAHIGSILEVQTC